MELYDQKEVGGTSATPALRQSTVGDGGRVPINHEVVIEQSRDFPMKILTGEKRRMSASGISGQLMELR